MKPTNNNPEQEGFIIIKDERGELSHVIRSVDGKPVWYTVEPTKFSDFEELAEQINKKNNI